MLKTQHTVPGRSHPLLPGEPMPSILSPDRSSAQTLGLGLKPTGLCLQEISQTLNTQYLHKSNRFPNGLVLPKQSEVLASIQEKTAFIHPHRDNGLPV